MHLHFVDEPDMEHPIINSTMARRKKGRTMVVGFGKKSGRIQHRDTREC